jgi:hypothetical protein
MNILSRFVSMGRMNKDKMCASALGDSKETIDEN